MSESRKATKEEIIGVFGRAAATYDRVGPSFFGHFGARLVQHACLQPGWRVLDVACGRGAALFPAIEEVGPGGSVLGVDLSESMVAELQYELQARSVRNAEVRRMDAEHLDLPDESFDAALCGFGLMFMPDLVAALREMRRVLRPGGVLGVTTWAGLDPRWSWQRELQQKYLPSGASPRLVLQQLARAEDLIATLESAGIVDIVVEAESLDVVYPDLETWWESQWSHGVRAPLDAMAPEALAAYQAEVFAMMPSYRGPEGYTETRPALIACGRKSSSPDQTAV